jgi:hypothetical protein
VAASAGDATQHARLAAATDALNDAAQLYVSVLEQTLQHLAAAAAAAAGVHSTQQHASGKRPAAAAATPSTPRGVLAFDGVEPDVAGHVSGCWLQLLRAQADVDLAMTQLSV